MPVFPTKRETIMRMMTRKTWKWRVDHRVESVMLRWHHRPIPGICADVRQLLTLTSLLKLRVHPRAHILILIPLWRWEV